VQRLDRAIVEIEKLVPFPSTTSAAMYVPSGSLATCR
jgi:hypothetical protein